MLLRVKNNNNNNVSHSIGSKIYICYKMPSLIGSSL